MFDQMLIFAPPILSSSQKSQLNDELKNGSKVEHTELSGRAKIQEKKSMQVHLIPMFFFYLEKKILYDIQSMSKKEEITGGIFFLKENLKWIIVDLKILERCSNNDVWRSFLIMFGKQPPVG